MQRKSVIQQESLVPEMHFAIAPYQVEFTIPNDQIYSIYFEKGLQILGSTNYPVQNHQKLKKLQIPIQGNTILFRIFSEKNSEYQWSIYKRVSQMEEFLQTKKFNLKDILKKEPEKRLQPEKKALTEKKDGNKGDVRKSDIRGSQLKGTTIRGTQLRTTQLRTIGQPSQITDGKAQIRGTIYNDSVSFESGQFTLKFYVFRALSNQELLRTIEEKVREKQEARVPLSEISQNKLPEVAKISEIQIQLQNEKAAQVTKQENGGQMTDNVPVETAQPVEEKPAQQTAEFTEKVQEKPAQEIVSEPVKQPTSSKKEPVKIPLSPRKQAGQSVFKKIQVKPQIQPTQPSQPAQPTTEAFSNYPALQQVEQTEQVQQPASQQPPVQQQPQTQEQPQVTQQQQKVPVKQSSIPPQKIAEQQGNEKKKIIVVLLIILAFYLVSFFDLLGGKTEAVVQQTKGKKVKKEKVEKVSGRKKFTG